MALPFDPDKLRATGTVPPLDGRGRPAVNTGFEAFSASEDGVMLYRSGGFARLQKRTLVWLDRSGKRIEVKSEASPSGYPALSPDGKHAAISMHLRP